MGIPDFQKLDKWEDTAIYWVYGYNEQIPPNKKKQTKTNKQTNKKQLLK
jgi:hypothetical protein